jgi:hypothetical protein
VPTAVGAQQEGNETGLRDGAMRAAEDRKQHCQLGYIPTISGNYTN